MILQTFFVAFLVSFFGSMPPGTINVSVMQLAILKKRRTAVFLALSASLVEFFYAGITLEFHALLTNDVTISRYFKIITSATLILLGLWNLFSKFKKSKAIKINIEKGRGGFVKGLFLGFLNPMTIPFWLAITTYLENDQLVMIQSFGYWFYLTGLSLGTFCVLLLIIALGYRFTTVSDNSFIVHKVPGLLLIGLGTYFLFGLIL